MEFVKSVNKQTALLIVVQNLICVVTKSVEIRKEIQPWFELT